MTSYANEHDSTTNNSNTTTTTNNNTAAAATGRATALAGTGVGFGFNSGSDSVVMHEVTTPPATATARVAAMLPHKLHHSTTFDDLSTTHGCLDYYADGDSSSLSDGREKADTTPENIKKIDDLIEQQQQQKHQQERYSAASTMSRDDYDDDDQSSAQRQANSIFSARDSRTAFGVGLAVDDSGVEFCLAKPAANACATQANTAFWPACLTTSPGSSDKEIICKSALSQRPQQQNYTHSNNITSTATTAAGNYNNHDSNKNEHDSTTTALQSGSSFSEEAHDDDSTASQASNSNSNTTTAAAAAAKLNKQQSLAFTIDSFNDKESDPAAQAAKYKSMMERFQNRHRRGASLSKLEVAGEAAAAKESATLTSSASATPLTYRNARNASNNRLEAEASAGGRAETAAEQSKVKLRARDRSTSRVRDAAKRHSWSPRSSTQELSTAPAQTVGATKNASAQSTQKALPPSSAASAKKSKPAPLQMPKGAANLLANRTHFTPRSTAMQMALQKVDFLCPQPPLADFKHLQLEADDISETGTYTLDGDNYTEEQKDLMNIDRNGQPRQRRRPKALDVQARESQAVLNANGTKVVAGINAPSNRCSNVLEVNYYHEEEQQQQQQQQLGEQLLASPRQRAHTDLLLGGSHQSAGAYLEQIKSRVLRHVSSETSPPKVAAQQAVPTKQADTGCFTSVTTSGVLAKQGALDARPKLTRRSSLSTSQIDSSEYVSNEAKLQAAASAYAAGGYTDHQKAEYRLNVFTNQKDSSTLVAAKFAATRQLIASPPDTPTSKLSDTAVLKTAQTKHDWIQEWARNARARSLASDNTATGGGSKAHLQQQLMTRSYTCASDTLATESLTDDSIYSKKVAAAKLNKTLVERYRLAGADCDYASDPALSSAYKPPKSPTKIPSPLHSLGRARSASRSRPPLQNMLEDGLDAEEASVYLQKTASAISNLQQSLSGKNSLKSPTNSNSPRAHSARGSGVAALYSPEECSPQHSLDSPGGYARQRRSQGYAPPRHTHYPQQQLMTSSINEQQLQLLTSGEYLMRQMRLRKNSFDGNVSAGQASPGRKLVQQYAAEAAAEAAEQQSLSPLRRSSSYSTKIATKRAARPQYQNIYTPPAARHNYTLAAAAAAQQQACITKSASSNNFRQMYSDYDEHLQYYINDEDDMEDERQYECDDGHYYSSGGEEEDSSYYEQHAQAAAQPAPNAEQAATPAVPLSNTRYNKALLMRIERSKQKVSGATATTQSKAPASAPATRLNASLTAGAGLVACPNTPELPRRSIKSATSRLGGGSATARQSMPREASLSRLARQVPSSLASAKKQLLQTAAAGVPDASAAGSGSKRVQPKYLDISKYKPAQGNAFLRKNDAKSTLKQSPADAMRRSPSSSSMAMSRADPTRTSNRSARSIAACMTASGTTLGGGYGSASSGRAASAARRDASVAKQKEAEMAMWKRRSTYDPMKAAAEDRRKKEEAKRLALSQSAGDEMPCESETTNTNSNSQRNSLEQEWQLDEQEYGEDEEF